MSSTKASSRPSTRKLGTYAGLFFAFSACIPGLFYHFERKNLEVCSTWKKTLASKGITPIDTAKRLSDQLLHGPLPWTDENLMQWNGRSCSDIVDMGTGLIALIIVFLGFGALLIIGAWKTTLRNLLRKLRNCKCGSGKATDGDDGDDISLVEMGKPNNTNGAGPSDTTTKNRSTSSDAKRDSHNDSDNDSDDREKARSGLESSKKPKRELDSKHRKRGTTLDLETTKEAETKQTLSNSKGSSTTLSGSARATPKDLLFPANTKKREQFDSMSEGNSSQMAMQGPLTEAQLKDLTEPQLESSFARDAGLMEGGRSLEAVD